MNSLRSGEPCHGFAHPLRAAASLSAAHLRATHNPDYMRLDIGNDTRTLRHKDKTASRHLDTSPAPTPKRGATAHNSAPAADAPARRVRRIAARAARDVVLRLESGMVMNV